MPTVYTDYSRIPLKTLKDIQENGYRNKSASRDYDPKLINEEIQRKLKKQSKKKEQTILDQFDELENERLQLKELLSVINNTGKKFLSEYTLTCIVNDIEKVIVDHI